MSKNKSHFANPRYLKNSPALSDAQDYRVKAMSIKKVLIVMGIMALAGLFFADKI